MVTGEEPSIVEQYAARRQRAKESWSWHMLFGIVPFCVFIWGPRNLAVAAWVAFAVALGMGVRRQFQIKRCPSCDACRVRYSIPFYRNVVDPYRCNECGVELVPKGEFF